MNESFLNKYQKLIEKITQNFYDLKNAYNDQRRIIDVQNSIEATEKLAIMARHFPELLVVPKKEEREIKNSIGKAMNITVSATPEGYLKIDMPMLCRRTDANKNTEFIRRPLQKALSKFSTKYQNLWQSNFKIENGVIAFVFCYQEGTPKNRCYDFDNINDLEIKGVTDDIAIFTLNDDGPFDSSRFYTARYDVKEHVEAYVMPMNRFSGWLVKTVNEPIFIGNQNDI